MISDENKWPLVFEEVDRKDMFVPVKMYGAKARKKKKKTADIVVVVMSIYQSSGWFCI